MIAGQYSDADGTYHGFVRSPDGAVESLDLPDAGTAPFQGTYPYAVNDLGVITAKNIFGGYVVLPFDVPGVQGTYPSAINNFEVVTGYYLDANLTAHGFIRDPFGKLTSFDPPGSALTGTLPNAINDRGEIAGTFGDAEFSFETGTDRSTLSTPPHICPVASGLSPTASTPAARPPDMTTMASICIMALFAAATAR